MNQDFEVFDSVLTKTQRLEIDSLLNAHPNSTRRLLEQPYFCSLAQELGATLNPLQSLAPVQANYLKKTADQNWFVAAHQDLAIPVLKHIPNLWSNPTYKEEVPFIQPPERVLAHCRILRLQIDGPSDLRLHIGHEPIQPTVPSGGALLFQPLTRHSSTKLSGLHRQRRVVQILYGPDVLEPPYEWYPFGT